MLVYEGPLSEDSEVGIFLCNEILMTFCGWLGFNDSCKRFAAVPKQLSQYCWFGELISSLLLLETIRKLGLPL